MHIEILNTGTELLLGTTQNTHGSWIGQELLKLGLRVQRQITVPDGEAVRDAVKESVERADVLIVTGGLGPTSDDLTREATAEAMGIDLIEDEHAMRLVVKYFKKLDRYMAESNKKQALIPCGAEVLPNPNGTAPGVYVPPRLGKGSPCAVFLLPGPPRELKPMYQAEVPHRLKALVELTEDHEVVEMKFTGVGESDFHEVLDRSLSAISDLEVGYCARPSEVDLRLIGSSSAVASARVLVDEAYPDKLISDDGRSLEKVVVDLLVAKHWTLTTAESCTGGAIASRITDVAGASEVFTHGFVTYANEAKREVMGVSESLLNTFGAVSEEVAKSMAQGALKTSNSDIAVSVTGIAGPCGGSDGKPVGTVWLGIAVKGKPSYALKSFYPKDRSTFKLMVSQRALDLVRLELLSS
ncbi:MAG: competence/damage-inducible protein A [Rubritalea sp.]|uniref:competence/damage-inducible protein A n=1 Tax=Rubritalea sp. TaxID=2109375 RepID=UPI003242EA5C